METNKEIPKKKKPIIETLFYTGLLVHEDTQLAMKFVLAYL